MDRTTLISRCLAVAFLAACASGGTPRAAAPAPDDEVSVGYGTRSRAFTTGSMSSFSPTENDARVARVEQLLMGRLPGLEVVPLSNGTYALRIHGPHGLRGRAGDEEPLLVIDDVPVSNGSTSATLASIAPRDVARIDVLKDASASGIYGVRGGNGVIIITTKRRR
jgi:TonB-dependent SusC/RagA subfamily outer membrane receptor